MMARVRRDVACVIDTHTWAGMAVSKLGCGLLPIAQAAMRFLGAAYRCRGVVLDPAEEASFVGDVGEEWPALPRRLDRVDSGLPH